MKRYAFINLFFLLISANNIVNSQTRPADIHTQTLHLQLASFFFFVVNENRIDIDSAFFMVSKQSGISRLYIIGEKMEDLFSDVNNADLNYFKEQLATSKGIKRVRLWNMIGSFYTFQPGSRKSDLDSAFSFLKKAEQEAIKLKDDKDVYQSLCVQGKYYFETDNLAMADSCFNKVISLCVATGNKEYEAMAYDYWSVYAPIFPIEKRMGYAKKALEIYQQLKENEAAINTLTNLAYMNFGVNQVEECKNINLQALTIEKKNHFPFTQYNEDLMAFISAVQSNHAQQLQYGLESIKSVQANGDSIGYAYFSGRLGLLYDELNKTKESLEWSYNSINAFKRMGGNFSVYKAAENLSNIVNKSASASEIQKALLSIEATLKEYPPTRLIDKQYLYLALAKCYDKLQQYTSATKYFMLLEDLQKEASLVNGNYNKSYFDIQLGQYAFNTKQYEKSRNYFMQVLNASTPQDMGRNSFATIHWMLFRVDSAEGKYEQAMQELLKYSTLSDSIYNATESKQTAEIKIQYETEKKDNNIRMLTKQAELSDTQLEQERLTRNAFIGGAIMLALLLGLAYNRYRLKQRSNKQLQEQQSQINQQNHTLQLLIKEQQKLLEEKEWLVKEIHHRVKNNMQFGISLLNSQAAHLEEGDALMAIQKIRRRMQVISLLHQKLYQGETSSIIDMRVYIREVVSYLKESFRGINHLYFDQQIDAVNLDISQAVPIGLILNEAITNCIKYAFPGNENGHITISFKKQDDGRLLLTIADNGVGTAEDIDPSQRNSFGKQLMQTLSEQLDGSMRIENKEGTVVKVCFRQQTMEKLKDTAFHI